MLKRQAGDAIEALAVAHLRIVIGIRPEDPSQLLLKLARIVRRQPAARARQVERNLLHHLVVNGPLGAQALILTDFDCQFIL